MKLIFWLSFILSGYSYFIYPVILIILVRIKGRNEAGEMQGDDILPTLTLIITAHNEENTILEKLANCLALEYPEEKLEIIVASDASSDRTDDIVRGMQGKGIVLVRGEERKGKEYAQGLAVKQARGEVLVFSDVGTRIPEDGLLILADIFRDPQVGAVSSVDRFITEDGSIVGEGMYVKYEMWLRKLESGLAGLVGLSGSFFAARKEVCSNWDIISPSDFNTALNCVRHGLKAVSNDKLIGIYKDIKSSEHEYNRKVRTVIRGITGMCRNVSVLNPLCYKLFSFEIWSHKIIRWAAPWFLLLLFASSCFLYGDGLFYTSILWFQCFIFLLILLASFSSRLRELLPIRVLYYFIITNLAIAHATILYISGKRITTWTPSSR